MSYASPGFGTDFLGFGAAFGFDGVLDDRFEIVVALGLSDFCTLAKRCLVGGPCESSSSSSLV